MTRPLELLAPAADKYVAREAILHGADAVYMGGPSHGARRRASNSIGDIRETVEFAHRFRARVYVTVNTVVYDSEIADVGVSCMICTVPGSMRSLSGHVAARMNLPPIAFHASTQCDNRTPEKCGFLEARRILAEQCLQGNCRSKK